MIELLKIVESLASSDNIANIESLITLIEKMITLAESLKQQPPQQ